MKDAFGGILNIFIIVVVLILIEGILGFVVNYTKAFKMKNIVISSYEEYEAAACDNPNSECYNAIKTKAGTIGFSRNNDLRCPNTPQGKYINVNGYFCALEKNKSNNNYVYSIEVQIDMNIPIIRKIMGWSIFRVRGDTRVINVKVGEK